MYFFFLFFYNVFFFFFFKQKTAYEIGVRLVGSEMCIRDSSGFVAGKLMKSMLRSGEQSLVLNIVKGMENSSNLSLIEKGFRNYFEENFTCLLYTSDAADE